MRSEHRYRSLGLDVYEVFKRFGYKPFSYADWSGIYKAMRHGVKRDASQRAWERFKQGLRAANCPHYRLDDGNSANALVELEDGVVRWICEVVGCVDAGLPTCGWCGHQLVREERACG